MTWFWWIIIILYIAGMVWYTNKRFGNDTEDDLLVAIAICILVVFWPLSLLLDGYFDIN